MLIYLRQTDLAEIGWNRKTPAPAIDWFHRMTLLTPESARYLYKPMQRIEQGRREISAVQQQKHIQNQKKNTYNGNRVRRSICWQSNLRSMSKFLIRQTNANCITTLTPFYAAQQIWTTNSMFYSIGNFLNQMTPRTLKLVITGGDFSQRRQHATAGNYRTNDQRTYDLQLLFLNDTGENVT